MNLSELQEQVGKWSRTNFPDNQPYHPLLGLQEEVGELAHAHLKMEQGIRGAWYELMAKKADAAGDIVIFLADYCSRNDIDLGLAVEKAWLEVSNRNWQANKENGQ